MADEETPQDSPPIADDPPAPEPPKRKAAKRKPAARQVTVAPTPTEAATEWKPPEVWLAYNPKSGRAFGHIPTYGSGPDGEFSPEEVARYFPTKAHYDAATKAPTGGEPLYVRVKKPDGTRDPAAFWKSTNPEAYGKEEAPDGES